MGNTSPIDESPFRDEIRALLKEKGHAQDPTYEEVAETIEQRYGEEYSVKQLRGYMNKHIRPEERMPSKQVQKELDKKRETIDIAAKRQDLVEIQESRMDQALQVEDQMDGMVLDQASEMIELTDTLLESLAKDYERLGILQSTSDVNVEVNQVQADPFSELMAESLGVAVEDVTPAQDDDADSSSDEVDEVEATFSEEVDEEESMNDDPLDKDPDEIDFDDLPDE